MLDLLLSLRIKTEKILNYTSVDEQLFVAKQVSNQTMSSAEPVFGGAINYESVWWENSN